jgi:DNA-binding CsgD family transcriptional regulator
MDAENETSERLDHAQVGLRARRALGREPGPAVVEAVLLATGGSRRLVDAVLTACEPANPYPWERRALLAAWDPVQRLTAAEPAETLPLLRAVVLAMSLGAPDDVGLLAAVVDADPRDVAAALPVLRSTGLLAPDGAVPPVVREAVVDTTPPDVRAGTLERLLDALVAGDGDVERAARCTSDVGLHHPRLAAVRLAAARRAVEDDPRRAGALFRAAVAAGADRDAVLVERARCAGLAGDPAIATRLADEVVATAPDVPPAAVHVLGAALVHQGLLGHAAAVYAPAALAGDRASAQLLTLVHAATGGPTAQAWPAQPGTPTLLDGAREAMVEGVRESLVGDGTGALSPLLEATAMLRTSGRAAFLPDTPAALAALVALHCGEVGHARAALTDAIVEGLGGPVAQPRHRLLLAWADMVEGRLASARELAEAAERSAPDGLAARDELFAHALGLGVARRANDLGALVARWPAALDALVQRPADLFGLLPLGEVVVAAARLGSTPRVARHVAHADEVLDALGQPALWAASHHWYAIHAAVLDDRRDRLEPHVRALVAAARTSRYADVLAEAARVWLQILGSRVDPPAVERVARRLASVGLTWEGTRLVGHAAARTTDRGQMVALLRLARSLRPTADAGAAPAREGGPGPRLVGGASPLSGRELEVARLVVDGRTYRQIAEQLYISPKTVEHHVARMRERLGLSTRGELLAHLRGLLTQVRAA